MSHLLYSQGFGSSAGPQARASLQQARSSSDIGMCVTEGPRDRAGLIARNGSVTGCRLMTPLVLSCGGGHSARAFLCCLRNLVQRSGTLILFGDARGFSYTSVGKSNTGNSNHETCCVLGAHQYVGARPSAQGPAEDHMGSC